jgi:uncharacterized membrane protein
MRSGAPHLAATSVRLKRKPTATLRRLAFDALEPRTMLDAQGLSPQVVVGRTLSSDTVSGVQNSQLRITYTVYNQEADALSGLILTTTLNGGVTFVDASIAPDRSGQVLAWSLGTLPAYGRASVEVTVGLNPTITQTVDTGSSALATFDAHTVSDSAPAAILRNQSVDPAYLASTPDANRNDPFIQELAATLDYDPQRIFAFLRDEVGYQSYLGSLQGARGTLWSKAGNALDEASLGVALYRASGIPARYVQGTLNDTLSQQLILSMFPEAYRVLGNVPVGKPLADPANDPALLAETRQHYWIQIDTGAGFVDQDTTFRSAQVGQTFTSASGTFAEVPDELRHKTRIRVNAEIYSQASALFGAGNGLSSSTVLDHTFNTVELVGRPLTVGNLVYSVTAGFVLVATTNTYTPYILVGDAAFGPSVEPETITGTSYQEILTNFPLGTQVLTGLFLDVALSGPGMAAESYTRTLFDRIGYAARQGLASPTNISVDAGSRPAISPLDLTTLSILSSVQSPKAAALFERYATELGAIASAPGGATLTNQVNALVALARATVARFAAISDQETANLASGFSAAAYFTKPRILAATSRIDASAADPKLELGFDLINDAIRAVLAPGQNAEAVLGFLSARGLFDSALEAFILPGATEARNTSAIVLMSKAMEEGIPLLTIDLSNLAMLQTLDLPAQAIARISASVNAGNIVVTPARSVLVNGLQLAGFLQLNPTTGESITIDQDGVHSGTVGYAITMALIGAGVGVILGELTGAIFEHDIWKLIQSNQQDLGKNFAIGFVISLITGLLFTPIVGFIVGLIVGIAVQYLQSMYHIDPPVPDSTLNLSIPFPTNVSSTASLDEQVLPQLAAGPVAADTRTRHLVASGNLSASWTSVSTSQFLATSLTIPTANVLDSQGHTVGVGSVSLTSTQPVNVGISGSVQYLINGQGTLSFHGADGDALGVGGDWSSYSGTATGIQTISVTSGSLLLNGVPLPAGTYTLATSSSSLSGHGATSSPNFSHSVTINGTASTVQLGSGTGSVSSGGQALDSNNGVTLSGYTGTITVSSVVDGTNAVVLSGTAAQVISLQAHASSLQTDQNTPVVLAPEILSSFADDFTLSVKAPKGWTVSTNAQGQFLVSPAAGLQGGTYSVSVIAQSKTNADIIAHTFVDISIQPTAAGMTFQVDPDDLLTVPYNGAQLPTSFRAVIHNTGPATDTFTIAASNVPAGFAVVLAQPSVTIPAGQTGYLGVYLVPLAGQALPAPGTVLSFTLSAHSLANPGLLLSETEDFTVPEIHGVTLVASPEFLSTTPGTSVSTTVTIHAVGNVSETVNLSTVLPDGLLSSNLDPIALSIGESKTITITLTPNSATPLNSSLLAKLVASFGLNGALTQTQGLSVRVAVPGADAIANASHAATQLGNTNLASRLGDLSIALTNLVQSPSDPVYKSQALASLDSVISLLAVDPVLSTFVASIAAGHNELVNATSANQVQSAVTHLGAALDDFGAAVVNLTKYKAAVYLTNNTQVAEPNAPRTFGLVVQNTGSETATYDFSIAGLPPTIGSQFSQPSVTLAAGAFANLTLTLTDNATSQLVPFSFTVFATVAGVSPIIRASASGSITVRSEFVSVTQVTATPPFTNAGGSVEVATRLLNAVNKQQDAHVYFTVRNAMGSVIFTSIPVAAQLNLVASIVNVNLGSFDTTGLPDDNYVIEVTVLDGQGQVVAGASGQATLLVGSPVTASLTVDQTIVPPGTTTVTNTLVIEAQTTLVGPLGVLSQTAIPTAEGVIHNGTLVYASGSDGIRVYDATNPAAPQLVRTFGTSATKLELHGGKLYALTRFGPQGRFYLRIYSLTDPTDPQLLGSATYNNQEGIPYGLAWHMVVTDTHVFVTLWGFTYLQPNDIKFQIGDIIAIDVTDPSAPHFVSALRNTYGTNNDGIGQYLNVDNNGGEGPMWEIKQVDANTLLVAGSTVAGDNTENGSGVVHVVDISDPAHMSIVRSIVIPGTVQAVGLSIEGNRAFVTGSTTGWQDQGTMDFHGNTVLAVLDITDPRNPALLGSQIIDRPSRSPADQFTAALGNGLFVFSSTFGTNTTVAPALFVVDATNPQSLVFSNTGIPAFTADLDGFGNYIYTTSNSGLIIYQFDAVDAIPVTARVTVPKNTGVSIVPGSFSVEPAEILVGVDFDTLVFQLVLTASASSRSITWRSTVSNLQPGEARDLTLGTTIDFASQGTNGQVTLPNTRIAAAQILGMTPADQTVRPGEAAAFTVKLSNPTSIAQSFELSVQGVPANWVSIAPLVSVPANTTIDVPLVLSTEAFAALASYGFTVVASNGFAGSVQGSVTLLGEPVLPVAQPEAHGVVLTLSPQAVTVGKGGLATYTLRLTNTGSKAESFHVSALNLPSGVTTSFAGADVLVPPGAGDFRELLVTFAVSNGMNAGAFAVSFAAQSTERLAQATVDGVLNVLAMGVSVDLTPAQSTPGSTYMMQVTNTGTQTTTFNLSLAGPAMLVATLAQSQVTLAPGATTQVPVNTSAAAFSLPGPLTLTAMAQAATNSNVRAAASASLNIAQTKGVLATANPEQINLADAPGTATFQIVVQNLGNVEDTYEATIVSTAGNVQASLIGLDGMPVQTISGFFLSALGLGALTLQVRLDGPGDGTVEVLIRSLSDSSVTSAASVHVTHLEAPIPTSTQITLTPNAPRAGEPLVLTAIITPAQPGGVVLGSVTFSIDGQQVTPVLLQQVNGVYQATTTVQGLSAGQHLISAVYSGDGNHSGSGASSVINVTAAPSSTAPRVLSVQRFGFHARPTTLVVTFDQALDPATASNPEFYRLTGPGGRIRILSAVYDAVTHMVILKPARLLPLSRLFHLSIGGTGQSSIRSAEGTLLDGDADGSPGGKYVARINRQSLVLTLDASHLAQNSLAAHLVLQRSLPRGPKALRSAKQQVRK